MRSHKDTYNGALERRVPIKAKAFMGKGGMTKHCD